MSASLMATTPADAHNRLAGILDLSNVRMKLADPEEGKGISDGQLDLAEQEYRRFLALHLACPDADLASWLTRSGISTSSTHGPTTRTATPSSGATSTTSRTSGCAAMTMRGL